MSETSTGPATAGGTANKYEEDNKNNKPIDLNTMVTIIINDKEFELVTQPDEVGKNVTTAISEYGQVGTAAGNIPSEKYVEDAKKKWIDSIKKEVAIVMGQIPGQTHGNLDSVKLAEAGYNEEERNKILELQSQKMAEAKKEMMTEK